MNILKAIKLLENDRGFRVELVTYKYRVSDEDGTFTFRNDEELIAYAKDQALEVE